MANPADPDLTYGLPKVAHVSGAYGTNNLIMAIIMDLENYRNNQPTVNAGHVRNTRKHALYTAKDAQSDTGPGLGSDGVLRDPGVILTLSRVDMNDDNVCKDVYYGNIPAPRTEIPVDVFWSLGPDGIYD